MSIENTAAVKWLLGSTGDTETILSTLTSNLGLLKCRHETENTQGDCVWLGKFEEGWLRDHVMCI